MSEFRASERLAERKRKMRIKDAINCRLEELSNVQRCAQCNIEFKPLLEMGRRSCAVHPMCCNRPVHSLDELDSSHYWTDHYPCCGAPTVQEERLCISRSARNSGCLAADHTTIRNPKIPDTGGNRVLEVDPWRDEGVARYVRIDPMFLLKRVAAARQINIEAQGGVASLLGTNNFTIVSDVSWISAHDRKKVEMSVGPLNLSVDVRNAYVNIMHDYGLPHRVVQHNFSSDSVSDKDKRRDTANRHRLDKLLEQAFAAMESGSGDGLQNMTHANPHFDDIMEFDANGNRRRKDQDDHTTGPARDEYYDVGAFTGHTNVTLDTARPSATSVESHEYNVSDTLHLAQEITSSIATSSESIAFYPFVIWAWAASENDEPRGGKRMRL